MEGSMADDIGFGLYRTIVSLQLKGNTKVVGATVASLSVRTNRTRFVCDRISIGKTKTAEADSSVSRLLC